MQKSGQYREIFLLSYPAHCCSVTQSCMTLCRPINCSMPGLPVPHHLLKFAQVQVHCISDAIQPSHPLTPSSSALNFSQHPAHNLCIWKPEVFRRCLSDTLFWPQHSVPEGLIVSPLPPPLSPLPSPPRGSSSSRDQTWFSYIAGRFFIVWVTRESLFFYQTIGLLQEFFMYHSPVSVLYI